MAPPPPRIEGLAFEELHHEERAAVLGDVVVEDVDRPRMRDDVREIALAQKVTAQPGVAREVRVQDLDRGAKAVANVDGCVHVAHSARPEKGDQTVLLGEGSPDPRVRVAQPAT